MKMSDGNNALIELRNHTSVDCDTMDADVARDLGPFEDCTSNQAIAWNELLKSKHEELLKAAIEMAKIESEKHLVPVEELAVEIAMVKLQLLITPYITGRVHVQTNPYNAYSATKTVENARRIVSIFKQLAPDYPLSRICIKIPSTWEGIKACELLEKEGIRTLATTLFSMEQGVLAAEAGCTYIAPYVNELKVHFDPSFKDENKLFHLCLSLQRYYELHSYNTLVLPASLTSVTEIMNLTGVHHITISPPLLLALSQTSELDESLSVFGQPYTTQDLYGEKKSWIGDEEGFRIAFTRSGNGSAERKLSESINIFCDMQDKLVRMMQVTSQSS